MERRYFLTLLSSIIGAVSATTVFASTTPHPVNELTKEILKELQTAIQGAFGPEFQLISAERTGTQTRCVIEHNGNVLEVSSSDLVDWNIEAATPM